MQVYLSGITPTFWKEIGELPEGLYNKENNQTTAVRVQQLLVAFVNKPVGTVLDLYVGGVLQCQAQVVNDVGLIYAKIFLPYTRAEATIDIQFKQNGIVVEAGSFATSNIAFAFEVQAAAFQQLIADAEQLADDNSITGIEQGLLEGKYGAMTGLTRRNEQTPDQYRAQTACLWKAFVFAGMEKGLVDSLKCLLGGIDITLETTRSIVGNRIFVKPQFDDANHDPYFGVPIVLSRYDTDTPHYYMADIPADFRTSYPVGGTPIEVIDPDGLGANPDFDATNVKSFTLRGTQAIGNEIFVKLDETDALVSIVGESKSRRPGVTTDFLGNINIASTVTVTSVVPATPFLPVQGVDFTVDILTGEITWLGTGNQPIDGATYLVDYLYRLDEPMKVIIRQIKPVQRSVVVLFENQVSSLPKAFEV
jgi:hypothetical protein